jgi:CheY-like chemotaxis protein
MPSPQPVTIVLVEDDPGHARLIEKNIRRSNITNEVVILSDGQKASDYLFREGEYADRVRPVPLLVLLDLNLPVIDGFQLLSCLKSNAQARKIPVIILTSSDEEREIAECYALGANVFITKPVDYEKFVQAIRNLGLFLAIVTLPQE